MQISKCVGIDLGTTSSVIAMMADDNSTIVCCTDRTGCRTFPSAIVYDGEAGGVRAGQFAADRRGLVPEPIVSVKRHIGDESYRVSTGPLKLSSVEVSAKILKEMKKQMEEYLHGFPEYADYVVDHAVVTIPACFASNARENTTKAGELAGLKVEFTLQDPVAAVMYHCFKNKIDNGIFMVYDLGGGTFDVSIVRLYEGDAFVLSIAGSSCLGGDSFDDILARHLLEKLRNSDKGYDLDGMDIFHNEEDRHRFSRLKMRAEIIKKALSSGEVFFESTNGIFEDKSGAKVDLSATVSRSEFEDLIRPLLESTIDECRRALREAAEHYYISLDKIDSVLLVGGSTHIPLVSRILEENFTSPLLPEHTKQPKPLIDEPDLAVGYGAAIAAAAFGVYRHHQTEPWEGAGISVTSHFAPAVGYGGLSNVRGSLQAEGGNLPESIYARVTRKAGGCTHACGKEFMLEENGAFVFEELPYEDESRGEFYSCEFIADGRVLLETGFDAAPGEILNPKAVLSRDYYIETDSKITGARRHLKIMEKGFGLPCTRMHTFTINEETSDAVCLRLFEGKKPLKQIRINLEEPLPPGTEVYLFITCDCSSRFTAQAETRSSRLSLEMEPSPPPKLPASDEVNRIVAAARSRIALHPEEERRVAADRMLSCMAAALQEAIEEGDAVSADEILEKINGFVMPIEMHPPKDVFDQKVRELERKNSESEKGGGVIAREIHNAANAGQQAYDSEDQPALSYAWRILEELEEILKEYPPPPPQNPPMWLTCTFIAHRIEKYINKYNEQYNQVPPDRRKDFDIHAQDDLRACQEILLVCRFQPSDEECEPYLQTIREIYPRWEKAMQLLRVQTGNAPETP